METQLWRLADIGKLMRRDWKNRFDVLILMRPANVFYCTGATSPGSYVMVTKQGEAALGVPASDEAQARAAATFDYIKPFDGRSAMIGSIISLLKHFQPEGIKSIGIEYSWLSHGMAQLLAAPAVKGEDASIGDCDFLVDRQRAVKDGAEIDLMRAAARVADAGMAAAAAAVRPGATEVEVAAEAEYAMRREGAEGFRHTCTGSGPRTAMARPLPTSRKIADRELVTIELHPVVNGYSSALCRTVCAGRPDAGQEEAFAVLTLAQQETAAMTRAGVTLAELEGNFHRLLREAGHEKHIFGRPVHGVGIETREAPFPSGGRGLETGAGSEPEAEEPLKGNTVLAVGSRGLSAGDWGVTVEDTVVAGAEGPEVLTAYPRTLAVD